MFVSVLIKTIGYFFASLAAFLALVISLPVKMSASGEAGLEGPWEDIFDGEGRQHAKGGFEVSILAGAVAVSYLEAQATVSVLGARVWTGRPKRKDPSLASKDPNRAPHEPSSQPLQRESSRTSKRRGVVRGGIGRIRPYLASDVRGRAMDFLRRCVSALHLHVDAEMVCGLDDPGVTGMIYAVYVALSESLSISGFRLLPSFEKEVLDAKGSVSLWALPVVLIWHSGMFFMSPRIRPLWRKKPGDRRPAQA